MHLLAYHLGVQVFSILCTYHLIFFFHPFYCLPHHLLPQKIDLTMNIYDMNQLTLLFESCGICLTVLLVIILVETLLASKVSYSCVSQGLNLCQCIFRDNLVINQGIKSSSIDSDSMSGFPPLTEPRVTLKRALHPSRREKVVKPGVEAYLIHNVTAFITCRRAWVCSLYFLFAGPRGFRGIKITSFLLYSQFIHTSGLQAPDH